MVVPRMTEIERDGNLALVAGPEANNQLLSTLTEAWSDVTSTAKQLGRLTHILGRSWKYKHGIHGFADTRLSTSL